MTRDLEDRLRSALRERAATTPVANWAEPISPYPVSGSHRRRSKGVVVLAGSLAVAAVAAVLSVEVARDRGAIGTVDRPPTGLRRVDSPPDFGGLTPKPNDWVVLGGPGLPTITVFTSLESTLSDLIAVRCWSTPPKGMGCGSLGAAPGYSYADDDSILIVTGLPPEAATVTYTATDETVQQQPIAGTIALRVTHPGPLNIDGSTPTPDPVLTAVDASGQRVPLNSPGTTGVVRTLGPTDKVPTDAFNHLQVDVVTHGLRDCLTTAGYTFDASGRPDNPPGIDADSAWTGCVSTVADAWATAAAAAVATSAGGPPSSPAS